MKKSPAGLSTGNKMQELMSSIESKLDLLASDDFDVSSHDPFAQSLPIMPNNRNYLSSPLKPSNLNLSDLSPAPHSPILSKIQQYEQQYVSQISSLNHKLSILQTENAQLKQANDKLNRSLSCEKYRCQILEEEQQKLLEKKIQEMKEGLMERMRDQIQSQVCGYIEELRELRDDVAKERKISKQYEKQIELLRMEKHNFEELYKEIMGKYKMLMQADIEEQEIRIRDNRDNRNNRNSRNNGENRDSRDNKDNRDIEGQLQQQRQIKRSSQVNEKDTITLKKSKNSKKNGKIEAKDLPRDQLIPFLTKGIEQLKQRLKLK